MKKNFLMVASLLIAAMLMVVSCSQEVAPKNENLVNASISIADTRSLSTTGEEFGSVTYEYKLTPKFSQIDTNSTIVGTKDWTPMPSDNKLGYVTQGLWLIEVRGSIKNTENGQEVTKVALEGSANHYFNNQNEVAKVFVDPKAGTGKVNINIQMQDLDELVDTKSKYEVKYDLVALDSTQTVQSTPLTRTVTTTANMKNISDYKSGDVSIATGYYRLTINVWGPAIESDGSVNESAQKVLLGGTTKSIRVLEGRTVAVTGSIEPKDFDKSVVDVMLIEPKGTLNYTTTEQKDENKAVTGVKTTFTVTPDDASIKTVLENAGYRPVDNNAFKTSTGKVYTVSYLWNVDGASIEDDNSMDVTYVVPGPKSISCTIVVKVKSFNETYNYMSSGDDSAALTKNIVVGTDFAVSGMTSQSN